MSSDNIIFGDSFNIFGQSTTVEQRFDWGTGALFTGNENNKIRVRRVEFTNDDVAATIDIRLSGASAATFRLIAGETKTYDIISPGLWVASSANAMFRAQGQG